MKTAILIAAPVALGLAGAGAWLALRDAPQAALDPTMPVMPATVDIAQGEALYAQNCAACHGANLEGQTEWRTPDADGRLPAPPHDETGHTWHHPDRILFQYTKLGGREALAQQGVEFDSGMPAIRRCPDGSRDLEHPRLHPINLARARARNAGRTHGCRSGQRRDLT